MRIPSAEKLAVQYAAWARTERGYSPNTIRHRRQRLVSFDAFMSPRRLTQATHRDVSAYLSRYSDPSTRNRYLADLRSVFRFLRENRYGKGDPCAEVESLREPRRLPRPIARKDAAGLLGAAERLSQRHRVLVALFLYAGLRRHEAGKVQWGDIDLDQRTIRVLGKGRKERVVPVNQKLATILMQYRLAYGGGGWLFPSSWASRSHLGQTQVGRMLDEVVEAAGLSGQGITPHRLRHTFATELRRAGVDVLDISLMLGHASVATTQVYTFVAVDGLADDVARLDYFSAIPLKRAWAD